MKKIKRNTIHDLSDEQLLDVYLNDHDLEKLGILYDRHIHNVYGLCLKYLKNRDDSQDAVMQIFEVIVKDLPKTPVHNFKSWLYVVSKNYCLMQLRKSSKHMNTEVDDAKIMESTTILHPIDEEENETLQQALEECLKKLKEEQKACVELFYYKQKCYKEIADELQLEEKKVKSFIQNGKRNLKICIEQTTTVNERQE